jgi:hypothetical protein
MKTKGLAMKHVATLTLTIILVLCCLPDAIAQTVNMKKEYAATLIELSDALLKRQLTNRTDANNGAINCSHCNVLHTRAAEAVYPFSVAYSITHDQQYLRAAIALGNWLIRQQEADGSWKETPEEWTGTSTDQLLMMLLSYNLISEKLTREESTAWKSSMEKAATYLAQVMTPEFASINYVATTTATLAAADRLFHKEAFRAKAADLAHRVISKMDEDGFINGEGGRSHNIKSGVDLGYNMEMSLWGLGYYAKLTNDTLVSRHVKHALKNHLYFIYPDGSMDASWGIRSNKWTSYGGATSDGCQVLFSLFADEDPRYATASLKNLQYLRTCMKDGVVGYGVQHWEIFDTPLCIYPTFAKAKNLAMAYELETKDARLLAPLPTEKVGWTKYFKTLDVVEVRTANFMATVTGYGYEDHTANSKSKYMYRPSGGAISNLWVKDHGFLQASSVTMYSRPEPMHFPEAPGIQSLTPRIEFTDSIGYFTNLFEFDSRLEAHEQKGKTGHFSVTAFGELKDKNWLLGGVAYRIDYEFADDYLQKTITLTYHDARPTITIMEPIIDYRGMTFEQSDARTVFITSSKKKFEFKLTRGSAELQSGKDKDKFWSPYPALRAFPIALVVKPPEGGFTQKISFKMSILSRKVD